MKKYQRIKNTVALIHLLAKNKKFKMSLENIENEYKEAKSGMNSVTVGVSAKSKEIEKEKNLYKMKTLLSKSMKGKKGKTGRVPLVKKQKTKRGS